MPLAEPNADPATAVTSTGPAAWAVMAPFGATVATAGFDVDHTSSGLIRSKPFPSRTRAARARLSPTSSSNEPGLTCTEAGSWVTVTSRRSEGPQQASATTMDAVPRPRETTWPRELTLTTDSSVDDQVSGWPGMARPAVSTAAAVAASVSPSERNRWAFGATTTESTSGCSSVTVTVTEPSTSPAAARTRAVPRA